MSNQAVSFIYILHITVFGAAISFCRGESGFIPRLTAVGEVYPSGSIPNLQAVVPLVSKLHTGGGDYGSDYEEFSRGRRSTFAESDSDVDGKEAASDGKNVLYHLSKKAEKTARLQSKKTIPSGIQSENHIGAPEITRQDFQNRDGQQEDVTFRGKRESFRSWGGKRDSPSPGSRLHFLGDGYNVLQWVSPDGYDDLEGPKEHLLWKRGEFKSWGGKRKASWIDPSIGKYHGDPSNLRMILLRYLTQDDFDIGRMEDISPKRDLARRSFRAWNGKR